MVDYVLVYFGGVIVGCVVMWCYQHYRDWKLDELTSACDLVLHNSHFHDHLKANPDLKDKLGPLYDWLLEHAPVEKEDKDVDAAEEDTRAKKKVKKGPAEQELDELIRREAIQKAKKKDEEE